MTATRASGQEATLAPTPSRPPAPLAFPYALDHLTDGQLHHRIVAASHCGDVAHRDGIGPGADPWFPDKIRNGEIVADPTRESDAAYARQVCAPCEVKDECLLLKVRRGGDEVKHGIAGAATPAERVTLRRAMQRRATSKKTP